MYPTVANYNDGSNSYFTATISKYAKNGLLDRNDLANAFDELNIVNPHYAAAEVLSLLNRGNGGRIDVNDPNDVNQVVAYASSRLPRRQNRFGMYNFAPAYYSPRLPQLESFPPSQPQYSALVYREPQFYDDSRDYWNQSTPPYYGRRRGLRRNPMYYY